MIKIALCLLLMLTLTACNNDRKSNDSTRVRDSSNLSEDSSSIFSNNVAGWLNDNLKTTAVNRKIVLEEQWKDDSLHKEEFSPEDNFYEDYKSVLHWSLDSSQILDLGSYGMIAVPNEDGRTKLEAGEPDTEIALINVKSNERIRLIYVGPSATVLSGRWLNNEEALVLGTFLNEDQRTDTLLWFVNVKENLFRLYNVKSE